MKLSTLHLLLPLLAICFLATACQQNSSSPAAKSSTTVTYRDVQPVLQQHCVRCHQADGPAPFPLDSYAAARKHSQLIAEVTADGSMPPWLPAPIPGVSFEHENRLSEYAKTLLASWHESGATDAESGEVKTVVVPPPPTSTPTFQADLVLTSAVPIQVAAQAGDLNAADGPTDLFLNLVIPLPHDFTTWKTVRAARIVPGNPRVVHHAILKIDSSGACRAADAATPEPGFPGMDAPGASSPPGHFVGWTPGKIPDPGSPDTGWRLGPGTDLVLQLHLFPGGKRETIRPEIHLTFNSELPSYELHSILIASTDIDIPAGAKAHPVTESFTTPADIEVLGVYPHAHYIASSIQLSATRPNQQQQALLDIPHWDFNWQDDYRFASPIKLPKGSTIDLTVTFDNSAENPRNPNTPPRRVTYGTSTSDEMAAALLQVRVTDDTPGVQFTMALDRLATQRGPDPGAWNRLGENHLRLNQEAEAVAAFQKAIDIDPNYATALYHLGLMSPPDEAIALHRQAVTARPDYAPSHAALAGLLANQARTEDDLETAADHFRTALDLNPKLARVNHNYASLLCRQQRFHDAIPYFERELTIQPAFLPAHLNRIKALAQLEYVHELHRHAATALPLARAARASEIADHISALLEAYPAPPTETVTMTLVTPPPTITMAEAAPYPEALAAAEYENADGTRIAVIHWVLRDREPLPFTLKPGEQTSLRLSPFHLNPGLQTTRLFNPLDNPDLQLFYAVP